MPINKLNYLKKIITPMGVAYTSLLLTFAALAFLGSYSIPSPTYQKNTQFNTDLMMQVRIFFAHNKPDNTSSNEITLPGESSVENESDADTQL